VHLSRLSPVLLAAVLAAGCANQPAGYDYDEAIDFAKLQTWTWLPEPQEKPSGDARLDSPLLKKRIEAAVSRTLETKGFKQSDAQAADFEVGYIVTVEKKISSSGISSSVGFGRYSGGSGFGISFGGPATQPLEYEEGTLIIDIKAKDSGKLVWRGSSTRRLGQAATPEESEKVVNAVVNEILANFPPKAGG
jgi:hypothetical protein